MPTSDQKQRQRRLGARIREARLDADLTGEELAAILTERLDGEETVSQSTVSYWETGRSIPTPAKIRALEAILPLRRGEITEILDPERLSSPPEQIESKSIAEALAEIRQEVRRLADLVEGKGPGTAAPAPPRPHQEAAGGGEPTSSAAPLSRKPA